MVAVGLACLLVGPAIGRGEFVGSSGAETYGHLWVLGWVADGWPAWPMGTEMAAGTSAWPVIDPLPTWLAGGVARAAGLTGTDGVRFAWNTYAFVGIVLAALGGAAWAEACGGRWEVGAVGVGTAPIFLGSVTSGLSEDWMLGLVAFALANAVVGRWRRAALFIGVTAWCGLYLAWLGGAALACIAIWRWRDYRHWGVAAVIALVLGGGAGWPFHARLSQSHRVTGFQSSRGDEPLWRINPWKSADLASFVVPGKVDTGGAIVREHPAYLGWTTIGLTGLSLVPPVGPVIASLTCVVGTVAVAVGDPPYVTGHRTTANNPVVELFRALPLAGSFNHLARVMLLGQMILTALAARGAQRFRTGAAAIAILLETALLSPARFPLPSTAPTSPDIYPALAALPPGPIVVIGEHHPQKPFFDQRFHGRRLLMNPNGGLPTRPAPGQIIVAFGDAISALTAERGPATVTSKDGAAWLVPRAK